jgi:hypothetical protein
MYSSVGAMWALNEFFFCARGLKQEFFNEIICDKAEIVISIPMWVFQLYVLFVIIRMTSSKHLLTWHAKAGILCNSYIKLMFSVLV